MRKIYVLLVFCMLFKSVDVMAQTIRYVKEAGTGSGSSWADASGDLQAMINESSENDEVWVAKGMYMPNRRADALEVLTPNDRFNSFVLKKNVKVYGSFTGTETTKENRDFTTNSATLSGNIGDIGIQTDNAYHVVIASGDLGANTVLDGFIVEDGYTEAAKGTTRVVGVNGRDIPSTRSPGIIIYYTTPVEFRNLIVRNNINPSIDQGSGGSYVFYGNANFIDCKFIGNKVLNDKGNGGGIFAFGSQARPVTVNLTNVEFTGNEAASAGALVVSTAATVIAENCLFEGNKANQPPKPASGATDDYVEGHAGAIKVASNSGVLVIKNSLFKNNVSKVSGGVLFTTNNGDVKMYNSRFENNSAIYGGAIYASASQTKLLIEGATFLGNGATEQGGGVYFGGSSANLRITSSDFFSNTSTIGGGGAIYITNAPNSIINTCKFSSNTSGNSGGAMFIVGTTSGVRVTTKILNSLFYNNTAISGGAFSVSTNSGPEFYNVTFFNNVATSTSARGSVAHFFATSAIAKITNSILWNTNNLDQPGRELSGQNAAQAALWSLTNTMTKVFAASSGTGNVVGQDPMFVSVNASDANFLELQASSYAVDKGDKTLLPLEVELDLNKNGRINNGIIDLGALEFGGAPYIAPTVLSVDENSAVDFQLVRPNTSLLGTLRDWEILAGNDAGAFKIDATTGIVSIANSTPLDFESVKQFILTIKTNNGLDAQKVYMVVNVNNTMEDPGTFKVANVIHGNVVTSYRPLLTGIAEFSSTVLIYVIKDDREELYPVSTTTDLQGNWSFRFPAELAPGITGFRVQTTGDLGTSAKSSTVTVNLKLYQGTSSLKANNILTPNGDGKNDVWIVDNLQVMYPKNEVTVFNKVGKVVFKQSNYQNDWNGTSNGEVLHTGTYHYIINIGKGLDLIKGTLTILRGR